MDAIACCVWIMSLGMVGMLSVRPFVDSGLRRTVQIAAAVNEAVQLWGLPPAS